MTDARWRFDEVDGVRVVRCGAIDAIAGVAHAFSTRIAFGRTDFDLGSPEIGRHEADPSVAAFVRAAGLGETRPVLLQQVHGSVIVRASFGLERRPTADGVIRIARDGVRTPVPAVRTADCVAVLVVDRNAAVVAAVHAGWRGLAARIGTIAVERFAGEGVDAAALVVALGPAILGCCYEVGDDVVSALRGACGTPAGYVVRDATGRTTVDLHAAMRAQLVAAGVPPASIHAAPWCTRCRTDQFFSFRAEGPATGRLMAAIGPAASP